MRRAKPGLFADINITHPHITYHTCQGCGTRYECYESNALFQCTSNHMCESYQLARNCCGISRPYTYSRLPIPLEELQYENSYL